MRSACTAAEIESFDRLVDSINPMELTAAVHAILTVFANDVALRYESDCEDTMRVNRLRTFWALFLREHGDLVPADVVPYMRTDHPEIFEDLPWPKLTSGWETEACGELLIGHAKKRFLNRNLSYQPAIYESTSRRDSAANSGTYLFLLHNTCSH